MDWSSSNVGRPVRKKVNKSTATASAKAKAAFRLEVPTEEMEQIKFCTYLTKRGALFFAVPNGGKRSMLEGIRLKRGGVMPGVPDICIPAARGGYHGLFVELKRIKGGVLSDVQRYWIAKLREAGYKAEVCHGADEAIQLVENYLRLEHLPVSQSLP